VNDPDSPLIGSKELGASPFRFRGTTLTDWLTAADPATRALSVSAKDRAAILPIGRSKQQVYWFTTPDVVTTSTWYADTLPTWVNAFNARRLPQNFAGKEWTPLLPDKMYAEADSVPFEAFGRRVTFPHTFPADSVTAGTLVRFSPMIDEITVALALDGLEQLGLGKGPDTDILAVSLSATDYIGHFYGPESKEQHDQIVRLDRLLGRFIDSVYRVRDSSRVIFALTADHGGSLIPELHGWLRVDPEPALDAVRAAVKAGGGDTTAVDFESGALFVDSTKLGSEGLTTDRLVSVFEAASKKVPGVLRVDRFADLAGLDTTKDYIARRWLHMFPEDMAPAAVMTLKEGNMFNWPLVATHGSPHLYDSHVPMIYYGPPFEPGQYRGFVRTVDIAPTLARVLGVTPTERLDGHPLLQALRNQDPR